MLPATGVAQGPIQPASFGYPGGSYGPSGYVSEPGCPSCGPGGCNTCPDTIYELLPDDRFSHRDAEAMAAFSSAFEHAYVRFEYLNWTLDDPGRGIVGAPRASGGERDLFNAVNPVSQVVVGSARLTTLDSVSQTRNNGVRGVFGLPTRIGLFEAGVSALERSDSKLSDAQFTDFLTLTTVFPAVTLLNNGTPSDTTMILFSEGLNVQLASRFFATEANFIMHPLTPNQPLSIQPLFGFQYISFWDNFDVFGTDIDPQDVTDPTDDIVLNHRISSRADNDIYAPQVGVRVEFKHEFFTLGATPKFMMGLNRHNDRVSTDQIFSATEGVRTTEEASTEFAPGLDLSVYGKLHLGKHLSLFVSYQLYYLDSISRATDNVIYDSINGNQPNIVLNGRQEGVFVDGVTVGGEFRFH